MIKSTHIFSGSMDMDSEDHLMSPDDYRLLLNGENDVVTKRGVVRNVKSNLLIGNPYLTGGENLVIGEKWDVKQNTCIYMVWNSLGFHGVFRYFRNKQGYAFGRIEKVWQVKYPNAYTLFNPNPLNFSKEEGNLITGITLVDNFMNFTDNYDRSKMMDIERANETNKRRRFNIFFNRTNFSLISTYTLNVYAPGGLLAATLTWTSTGADYTARVNDFATAYKNSSIGNQFNLISCGEHAIAEMVVEGEYYINLLEQSTILTNASITVAENFYPDKDLSLPAGVGFDYASRDLFDELLYQPLLNPTVSYGTDATKQINLVKNRMFQFCARYQYFDNSWGTYGPRSKIPLPQRSCGDENNYGNTNNYILVDFYDPRLENPSLVSIIQSVELAVNEPAIDQVWKTVKVFDQHEVAGRQQQRFKFYNDGNYPAIAAATITRDYDALFITHKSKVFIDDRQFLAGGVEGYETPCSNAKLNLTLQQPDVVSGRYNVSLKLGIQNALYTGSTANGQPFQQQPVLKFNPNSGSNSWGTVFRNMNNTEAQPGQIGNYKQGLPIGGFIAYLAGTPYYGVSKQNIPASKLQLNGGLPALQLDATTGAILFNGSVSFHQQLWSLINDYTSNFTVIPQEVTIPNVPNGRYLLRIASHLTLPNDIATGLDYQRTSTNAFVYNNGLVNIFEQEIVVNNGNVTGLDWIIHDLSDPNVNSSAIMAYVVADDNPAFDPLKLVDYMNETRIEYARIQITDDSGFFSPIQHADHNGYVFSTNISVGGNNATVSLLISGRYSTGTSASINVYTGAPWGPVAKGFGGIGAFRSTSTDIKNKGRTHLFGTVINAVTGAPQPNVNVVNTQGSVFQPGLGTDSSGQYRITTYPRVVGVGAPYAPRNGKVIFSAGSGLCQFSFINDAEVYGPGFVDIHISDSAPPDYDNTHDYLMPNTLVTVLVFEQAVPAFKRGGDFNFARVYRDEGGRKCAVVTSDAEQLHIPFYTEAINGIIPPRGLPVIDWQVYNEPPEWAVSWQWCVTYNLQLNFYLQWCMNKVTYVDEDDNSTVPGNATLVKINVDNIGFYTVTKHPDSIINYTPVKGDRLRLIKDQNGIFYNSYYDFEIVKTEGTDLYIYPLAALQNLTAGVFFEVYTPKSINANNLYYEFGPVYQVRSAVFNGVLRKYHATGIPLNDQSYGPNPQQVVTPATGKFDSGDVYYRLRNIPINVPGSPPYVGTYTEKLMQIDDSSISDFYASKAPGYGRVNVFSPDIGQVYSPTAIRISNPYISGTKINGLRNFEAGNRKQLSTDYGLISKLLVVDDSVMKALCENSVTVSMYVNKGVIHTSTVQTFIAVSDDILNNAQRSQRSFGTVNPASAQLNDEGDIFYWDENKSVVARSSGNGLVPVNEYKMTSEFNSIGAVRRVLKYKNSRVVSTYHTDRDLYILSFNPLAPFPGIKPSVKFRVPVLATTGGITYPVNPMLKVTVVPINIDLVVATQSDPNFPDTGKIIETNTNALANGWTAVLDANGYITITAPDASGIYSNNELVLTFNYTDANGAHTVRYNYNLSMGVAPSPLTDEAAYPGGTYAFCKRKNGWIQKYDFIPEYFGRLNKEIVSFKDGELWLHEAGAGYNTFYGTKYNRVLDFICTGDKDIIATKQFKGIEVNSKVEHFCPSITTPSNQLYPAGMTSRLRKYNFKLKQGKFYSDILRDETTPGFTDPNVAIMDGRPMLGQLIKIRLENDSDLEGELLESQVLYFYSEVS